MARLLFWTTVGDILFWIIGILIVLVVLFLLCVFIEDFWLLALLCDLMDLAVDILSIFDGW